MQNNMVMNKRLLSRINSKPRPKGIGKAKTDLVKSPNLYDAQQAIWDDKRRFNVALCGRRFGKTILIRKLMIDAAIQGLKIGLFAPDFKSIKKTWNAVEEVLQRGKKIKVKDSQQKQIFLKNGGFIAFWSLTNKGKQDSARGDDYDLVIYEETQSIGSSILKYHWENVARATLTDRKGCAWFIGTPPNSRKHFFYQLIVRGAINSPELHGATDIKLPKKNVWSKFVKWKTFRDDAYSNPFIEDEEIEDAKNELPELIFLQEYLAICVEYSESPFFLCAQTKKGQDKIFASGLIIRWRYPIWLSFDFNKNPMAATLWQKGPKNEFIHCIAEFGAPKKKKVNIHYTCALIRHYIKTQTGVNIGAIDRHTGKRTKCPSQLKIYVTGDATGNTGDPRQIKSKTFYEIICEELGLNAKASLKLFKKNPPHAESFLQVNTWMSLHPDIKVDEINCKETRYDILNSQATAERGLDKIAYDPHFGDTLRYFFEAALPRKYNYKKQTQ
jgi:hypothetical protein